MMYISVNQNLKIIIYNYYVFSAMTWIIFCISYIHIFLSEQYKSYQQKIFCTFRYNADSVRTSKGNKRNNHNNTLLAKN